MSDHIKTGGPAFPIPGMTGLPNDETIWPYFGMTLRDYFAAEELSSIHGKTICSAPEGYDRIADHCYRMADAMLRARENKP
jgi:hypothetical protein